MTYTPEIYISYAWQKQNDGTSWPQVLKHLHKVLTERGYRIVIDINSISYRDSIKKFMQKLGEGNYIILIISEKYLRSLNCMYEVLQILKYPNFRERIFPIVMEDAQVHDTKKIIEYIKHWDSEILFLNKEAKSLSNIAYAAPIFEDIEIMNEIRRIIANFGHQIGDMNVLNVESHETNEFKNLLDSLEQKIEADNQSIDLKTQYTILKTELVNIKDELDDFKIKYSKAILDIKEKENEIAVLKIKITQLSTINRASPPSTKTNAIEFETFLGFTRNSSKKDIIQILGEPSQDDENNASSKYDFVDINYDNVVNFSYYKSSQKLMAIDVYCNYKNPYSTIAYLEGKDIKDDKLNFLGKHISQIIEILGTPGRISSGNYSYDVEKLHVNFICYDTNDDKCSCIQIQHFGNET